MTIDPRPEAGQPFRLSYIIGTYPSLTTTFIDREIEELVERGVDVQIISVRRPRGELSERQRALQARVTYLVPAHPIQLALAYLRVMLLQPATTVGLVAHLLSRPHQGASRLRTAFHALTGIYAAHRLAHRRGVHIHAHFVDRAAIVARVAARLLGSRYSVTAHANDIYVNPVLLPEKFRHAAFAVTCTEYNRRHLETVLGPKVGGKVMRLYHGLDIAGYEPARGSMDAEPWILSVGQLKEKKGLRYLVEAVELLRGRWPALRCTIVGDGPLRKELQDQIDAAGLGDRVSLAGFLPHPEVVALYRQAPLFVLPCVVAADGDRDGIPNVILEAMATGLTVIATSISGIPEVVHDGETGLLVPPGDAQALAAAIEQALADTELRARIGGAGRDLVMRDFERHANVDRLLIAMTGG